MNKTNELCPNCGRELHKATSRHDPDGCGLDDPFGVITPGDKHHCGGVWQAVEPDEDVLMSALRSDRVPLSQGQCERIADLIDALRTRLAAAEAKRESTLAGLIDVSASLAASERAGEALRKDAERWRALRRSLLETDEEERANDR